MSFGHFYIQTQVHKYVFPFDIFKYIRAFTTIGNGIQFCLLFRHFPVNSDHKLDTRATPLTNKNAAAALYNSKMHKGLKNCQLQNVSAPARSRRMDG